jgi:hypothetical protein
MKNEFIGKVLSTNAARSTTTYAKTKKKEK